MNELDNESLFKRMLIIYNALEKGWTVSKTNITNAFEFTKSLNGIDTLSPLGGSLKGEELITPLFSINYKYNRRRAWSEPIKRH